MNKNMFYLIYFLIFKFYAHTVKAIRPEIRFIWYRNSFILGYWEFLKSDIDITILIEKKDYPSIRHIYRVHSFFRKYIKVIGELSIYSIEDLSIIASIINPIELSRDIKLKTYMKIQNSNNFSKSEKLIFASKYLIANHKLPNQFNMRNKKKNYLAKILDIEITSIDDLKNFICDKNPEEAEKLEKYLRGELPDSPSYSQVDAVFFNKLIHHKSSITVSNFSDENFNIIIDLIKWEIWGCYAHSYLADPKIIKDYIQKLLNISTNELIETDLKELKEKARKLDII